MTNQVVQFAFTIGERVIIDGDAELLGVVISASWSGREAVDYEVQRFHAGVRYTEWYRFDRLREAAHG